jgi:hypothetical protein
MSFETANAGAASQPGFPGSRGKQHRVLFMAQQLLMCCNCSSKQ